MSPVQNWLKAVSMDEFWLARYFKNGSFPFELLGAFTVLKLLNQFKFTASITNVDWESLCIRESAHLKNKHICPDRSYGLFLTCG